MFKLIATRGRYEKVNHQSAKVSDAANFHHRMRSQGYRVEWHLPVPKWARGSEDKRLPVNKAFREFAVNVVTDLCDAYGTYTGFPHIKTITCKSLPEAREVGAKYRRPGSVTLIWERKDTFDDAVAERDAARLYREMEHDARQAAAIEDAECFAENDHEDFSWVTNPLMCHEAGLTFDNQYEFRSAKGKSQRKEDDPTKQSSPWRTVYAASKKPVKQRSK